MINIRRGLFETNSSSVHAICLLTGAEYAKFKSGEYYADIYANEVISKEEALKRIGAQEDWDDETIEEELVNERIFNEESFYNFDEFEIDAQKITKDGQDFVILSYSGYSG